MYLLVAGPIRPIHLGSIAVALRLKRATGSSLVKAKYIQHTIIQCIGDHGGVDNLDPLVSPQIVDTISTALCGLPEVSLMQNSRVLGACPPWGQGAVRPANTLKLQETSATPALASGTFVESAPPLWLLHIVRALSGGCAGGPHLEWWGKVFWNLEHWAGFRPKPRRWRWGWRGLQGFASRRVNNVSQHVIPNGLQLGLRGTLRARLGLGLGSPSWWNQSWFYNPL